eukprot:TRINITY_DN1220_c0_g1_i2.p1 TRINITY_DN1220_c0_g1~~TRINITY_DN1220_c0_g1_i2.p1  ORF type:complete len:228 (-),score=44.39 TRINITY_DN1220_c0_g1_i2:184-867(-)
MIRRPPRSTLSSSSAASDVYKRQVSTQSTGDKHPRMATVALRIPPSGVSEPQEAAGELTCISALLSLSLPKCPRSRDACAPLEHDRPHKAHKCSHNNSTAAPVTPRGTTQPSLDPGSGVWVNKWVRLQRGKYEGRRALIVGVTTKKFRVRVEGVEHQLEFYPSMFKLEPQEGRQRVQEGEEEAEAMQVDAGSSGTANTPAVPTHQALAQICCNQSSTNQSLSGAFYY